MNSKLALAISGTVALSLISSCSKHPNEPVYVAFQLNSKEEVQLAQDVLHQTRKRVGSETDIVIDVMESKRVINLYSDKARSSSFLSLMDVLEEKPSEPSAIVQAMQRAARFRKQGVKASTMVVTSGTCDAPTLRAISNVAKSIPPSTQLFLIGVAPENRLCMSQAFASIRDRVKFASTDEEWISVINQL